MTNFKDYLRQGLNEQLGGPMPPNTRRALSKKMAMDAWEPSGLPDGWEPFYHTQIGRPRSLKDGTIRRRNSQNDQLANN